jgi:hypothetical protein
LAALRALMAVPPLATASAATVAPCVLVSLLPIMLGDSRENGFATN